MMDVESIRALGAEQSALAAQRNKRPATLFSKDTCVEDARHAPWLGIHVARGWDLVIKTNSDEPLPHEHKCYGDVGEHLWLFLDKGGIGSPDEPALTLDQLGNVLCELLDRAAERGVTLGVGIVEEGQFQLHLGVYESLA